MFTDSLLKSGWAKEFYGIEGDSVVSFMSAAVDTAHLPLPVAVRLSLEMLYFVCEVRGISLLECTLLSRLFTMVLYQHLGPHFRLKGDCIYMGDIPVTVCNIRQSDESALFYLGLYVIGGNNKKKVNDRLSEELRAVAVRTMELFKEIAGTLPLPGAALGDALSEGFGTLSSNGTDGN